MVILGAIANKMRASQETFLWVKITQASFHIIKWYVPKKKASYMIYLKAYVVKLERNYIGMWVSGVIAPEASGISKNQMKWKPDIYFLKRKLHTFFIFFLKAYEVKLERNYIDIWGSGGDSLRSQRHF